MSNAQCEEAWSQKDKKKSIEIKVDNGKGDALGGEEGGEGGRRRPKKRQRKWTDQTLKNASRFENVFFFSTQKKTW